MIVMQKVTHEVIDFVLVRSLEHKSTTTPLSFDEEEKNFCKLILELQQTMTNFNFVATRMTFITMM